MKIVKAFKADWVINSWWKKLIYLYGIFNAAVLLFIIVGEFILKVTE